MSACTRLPFDSRAPSAPNEPLAVLIRGHEIAPGTQTDDSRHGAIINIGGTCWQVGSPCTRRLLPLKQTVRHLVNVTRTGRTSMLMTGLPVEPRVSRSESRRRQFIASSAAAIGASLPAARSLIGPPAATARSSATQPSRSRSRGTSPGIPPLGSALLGQRSLSASAAGMTTHADCPQIG